MSWCRRCVAYWVTHHHWLWRKFSLSIGLEFLSWEYRSHSHSYFTLCVCVVEGAYVCVAVKPPSQRKQSIFFDERAWEKTQLVLVRRQLKVSEGTALCDVDVCISKQHIENFHKSSPPSSHRKNAPLKPSPQLDYQNGISQQLQESGLLDTFAPLPSWGY